MPDLDLFDSPAAPPTCGTCDYRQPRMDGQGHYCGLALKDVQDEDCGCSWYALAL